MGQVISRMGKRGTVVVPAELRKRYGLDEGMLVIAEERDDGILLRPAVAVPVEIYSAERRAEFLLANAVDQDDERSAREAIREMGLDPDAIQQPQRPK